ncbi:MAG TPA: LamG domain-containing protein [Phycisphaerales bacterium]|nr:LamG domain-containing protein [Phycisphaerales bacterium]
MKRLALLIIILTLARFVNATTWNDGVVHDLDYIIDSYLQISGTTTVNVYAGGGTTKWIYSQHNSKLNIFDGTFGEGLSVGDNSVAIVHSGIFGSQTNTDFCIVVNDQSITTIYGGTYSGTIRLYGYPGDSSTLEFHGANFQIGGQDVSGLIDAEELALTGALSTVTSDGAVRSYGGVLTGALQDGSILNNMLEITCAGENQANLILTPAPIPLVADAGPNQTVKDINNDGSEEVTLDGSGSTSIGRSIVSWVWTDDLGDTIPDGEIVTAPLSLGVHTITLTVTDDHGLSDPETVGITVVRPPITSMIAHWPFDLDASDIESGFHGSFEGGAAVTNTPGEYRIGTGMVTLDGVDDRVSTPYAGISGAAARTTCAWFKCDGDTGYHQSILSYGGASGSGSAWRIWINGNDGSIINAMGGGNANGATTGLYDGQWHHIAVTFPDGGTHIQDVKIYVDGYEDSTWYTNGDTQTVNTFADNAFEIGMANGGTIAPFDGNIDDVRVYDRALTDTEILAMQDERPISDPVIGLSDSNLYFLSELSGPNPVDQVFSVQNSGGGTLNWQISESISWVNVSPGSGVSTGQTDTVTVSFDTAGLTGGFYSCDLIISSPDAINNPQLVTVNLYIAEAHDLIVPSEYPTIRRHHRSQDSRFLW